MRKVLLYGVCFLFFALVSCTQPDGVVPPPVDIGQERLSPEEILRKAGMNYVYADVEAALRGENVDNVEILSFEEVSDVSMQLASFANAENSTTKNYVSDVQLTDYETPSSVKINGIITFYFTAKSEDASAQKFVIESYEIKTAAPVDFVYGDFDYQIEIETYTPLLAENLVIESLADSTGDVDYKIADASDSASGSLSVPSGDSLGYVVDNQSPVTPGEIGFENNGYFASGVGTEEYPFEIANIQQFSNIAEYSELMEDGQPLYFSVTSTLDFSGRDWNILIPLFRGEIDFNGNSMTNVDEGDATHGYFIQYFNGGTISNLSYHADDLVLLTYFINNGEPNSSSAFVNVDVYGDVEVINNASLYTTFLIAGSLEFNGCTSYANYNVKAYSAVFVGGGVNSNASVKFINCTNNGTLVAQNAALLVGNSYNGYSAAVENVTVENLVNNGLIRGVKQSNVYCGMVNNGTTSNALNDKYKEVSGTGEFVTTSGNVLTSASYSDGKFSFRTTAADEYAESFAVSAYFYAYYKTTGEQKHTLYTSFESAKTNGSPIEFDVTYVVDSVYIEEHPEGSLGTDDYGNPIFTIEDETYFVREDSEIVDGETVVEGIWIGENGKHYGTLSYQVNAYDSNDRIIDTKDVSVGTTPGNPSAI